MQNRNPFFDDMSRMAGDVMGLAKGMRDEVEAWCGRVLMIIWPGRVW
jgi:hypothetical protein